MFTINNRPVWRRGLEKAGPDPLPEAGHGQVAFQDPSLAALLDLTQQRVAELLRAGSLSDRPARPP